MNKRMPTGNRQSAIPEKAVKIVGKMGDAEQQKRPQTDSQPEVAALIICMFFLYKNNPQVQRKKNTEHEQERPKMGPLGEIPQPDR